MSDAAYIDFGNGSFMFECVTSESAMHSATVTEHVVEQGANISDHVRPGNDKISLEIFVSNTPLNDLNGLYSGGVETVALDVPVFKQQLYPTPGSLISTASGALGDAINGKPAYNAIITKRDKINVVRDIVTMLDGWRISGTIGKAYLPWKTYENVVLTQVSPTRKSETGDGATLTIELQEIRLVESLLVTAPKDTRAIKAKPKGNQGPVQMKEVTVTATRSTARAILDKLKP